MTQDKPEVPSAAVPAPVPRLLDAGDRAGVRREVLRLAGPVVIQQLFHTMMFYVDTIMIGRVGREAMAAMGVVGPVSHTVVSVLTALEVGTIAVVSRAVGAGDERKQQEDAATSMATAAGFGLVLSVLGFFFLPLAAHLLHVAGPTGPVVTAQAKSYLVFLGASQLFVLLQAASSSILRAAGDSKTPMAVAIICNVFNMGADYVLIFGKLGFPAMGVKGAGIATAISIALQGIITSAWLFLPRSRLRLRLSSFAMMSRGSLSRLVKVAVPAAVERLVLQSGWLVYINAVTRLGTESLAAHRSAIAIESLSFMPGYGFSIACSALVGQSLGARRPDAAEVSFRESARISTWVMSVIGVAFLVANVPLMRLFIPGDESVIHIGALCLAISAFEQPFLALAMVYGGALRGAGDTRSPVVVGLVGVWLVRVPLAYLLAFPAGLGLYGVWITMIVDWVARALIFAVIYRRGRWKQIKL